MPDYLVTTHIMESIFNDSNRLNWNIVHTTAAYTARVIMIFGPGIEPPLRAADFQFLYDPRLGQYLQIAVNSTQTDPR